MNEQIETREGVDAASSFSLNKQILSDITVFNKYAKYIPKLGRRETWEEICKRNMDMHIKKFPNLKEKIKEVYKRSVLPKKVLPSMRTLQFAGKPVEINNSRLYNCFSENTKFITKYGVKSFEDFKDGDETTVLSHKGHWKKAVIKNYREQNLNKITIKQGRHEIVEYATDNHRWILSDLSETNSLKEGDYIKSAPFTFDEFNYDTSDPFEKLYWAYGYIFGDGTVTTNGYSLVRLCGHDKNKFHYRFKELGFKSSESLSLNGDCIFFTGKYQKEIPDPKEDNTNLIRAFVTGYLDADAKKTHSQSNTSKYYGILSADKKHQYVIEKLFPVVGVFISSERYYGDRTTNFGKRNKDTKDYNIFTKVSEKSNATKFRVQKIEKYKKEQVWCLEVEDDKSFVLASGISTGNCSYLPIDDIRAFNEIMFLLLSGCGCGYSVQLHHIEKLPEIKVPNKSRKRRFLVGDSIEGWADSIKVLIKSYFQGTSEVEFDFSDIREKGLPLLTAGGKAPGPQPLKECLIKIRGILDNKNTGEKLTSLECHDIVCHIADAVLAGGIRRAACISLFSADDEDMLTCKFGNWWELNPQRARANNSVLLLRHKLTEDFFKNLWKKVELSGSGEPGIILSNDKDMGYNPCVEASLKPFTFCNLNEINVSTIESQKDFNQRCIDAAFLATLQASYTNFHYLRDIWRRNTEKDALLGISLTGTASRILDTLDIKQGVDLILRVNEEVSKEIDINKAARVTCIKPAGTSSIVLGTSSGIHAYHEDYYIRRIRILTTDPLYWYLSVYHPEILEKDEMLKDTYIITVPQQAPEGAITRNNETTIEFLNRIKKYYKEWVLPGHRKGSNTHNISATVSIRNNEWKDVGNWIWDNKEYYNGLSFLPYDGGTYIQPPFEKCSKETYKQLDEHLSEIDLTRVIENQDNTNLKGEIACGGNGSCEIM